MNERLVQVDETIRVEDKTDPYFYPQNVFHYSDHMDGKKGKTFISHNRK